jgi:hypothetical protein
MQEIAFHASHGRSQPVNRRNKKPRTKAGKREGQLPYPGKHLKGMPVVGKMILVAVSDVSELAVFGQKTREIVENERRTGLPQVLWQQ